MTLSEQDREALVSVESSHRIVADWMCACGEDCFGGSARYSAQLLAAHVNDRRFATVEAIVARHVTAALTEAAEAIEAHMGRDADYDDGMENAAAIVRDRIPPT